jgi:hypothetical protein
LDLAGSAGFGLRRDRPEIDGFGIDWLGKIGGELTGLDLIGWELADG